MSKQLLQVQPLPASDREIGAWLWAMQEARRRTLRLVEGLDQRTLDWTGLDGRENAIGTLLYHIGLVELSWLYEDILLQSDLPEPLKPDFPYELEDATGRLTPVLGVALDLHMERLARSRKVFLETLREMSAEEWGHLRFPGDVDYGVTPGWAVFHLIEHEAGHAFQISSLKARAGRHFC